MHYLHHISFILHIHVIEVWTTVDTFYTNIS